MPHTPMEQQVINRIMKPPRKYGPKSNFMKKLEAERDARMALRASELSDAEEEL